jgi:hypothetical protein
MKHKLLITAAAATSAVAMAYGAFNVNAADKAAPAVPAAAAAPSANAGDKAEWKHRGPAKSRQEAIERAKERVKKLESMSDAEWKAKQDKQKARRKQAKDMTPEERAKLKEKFKAASEKKAQ